MSIGLENRDHGKPVLSNDQIRDKAIDTTQEVINKLNNDISKLKDEVYAAKHSIQYNPKSLIGRVNKSGIERKDKEIKKLEKKIEEITKLKKSLKNTNERNIEEIEKLTQKFTDIVQSYDKKELNEIIDKNLSNRNVKELKDKFGKIDKQFKAVNELCINKFNEIGTNFAFRNENLRLLSSNSTPIATYRSLLNQATVEKIKLLKDEKALLSDKKYLSEKDKKSIEGLGKTLEEVEINYKIFDQAMVLLDQVDYKIMKLKKSHESEISAISEAYNKVALNLQNLGDSPTAEEVKKFFSDVTNLNGMIINYENEQVNKLIDTEILSQTISKKKDLADQVELPNKKDPADQVELPNKKDPADQVELHNIESAIAVDQKPTPPIEKVDVPTPSPSNLNQKPNTAVIFYSKKITDKINFLKNDLKLLYDVCDGEIKYFLSTYKDLFQKNELTKPLNELTQPLGDINPTKSNEDEFSNFRKFYVKTNNMILNKINIIQGKIESLEDIQSEKSAIENWKEIQNDKKELEHFEKYHKIGNLIFSCINELERLKNSIDDDIFKKIENDLILLINEFENENYIFDSNKLQKFDAKIKGLLAKLRLQKFKKPIEDNYSKFNLNYSALVNAEYAAYLGEGGRGIAFRPVETELTSLYHNLLNDKQKIEEKIAKAKTEGDFNEVRSLLNSFNKDIQKANNCVEVIKAHNQHWNSFRLKTKEFIDAQKELDNPWKDEEFAVKTLNEIFNTRIERVASEAGKVDGYTQGLMLATKELEELMAAESDGKAPLDELLAAERDYHYKLENLKANKSESETLKSAKKTLDARIENCCSIEEWKTYIKDLKSLGG